MKGYAVDPRQYAGGRGGIFKNVFLDANTNEEIKPPPGGWTYLFIQNNSGADIYYSEGTPADSQNGIVLESGQWYELSSNLGNALPNGSFWLRGSAASPTRQRVQIKGG